MVDINEQLSNGLYNYLWAVAREVEEIWGGWGSIVGISVDDLQHVMVQAILERERQRPGHWDGKSKAFIGKFGKWQAVDFLRYWLGMKRSRTAEGGWTIPPKPIPIARLEAEGEELEQDPWPRVELRLVVKQVLDDLGDEAYSTIAARLAEGRTQRDIGKEIGLGYRSVWVRKERLKEALQEALT